MFFYIIIDLFFSPLNCLSTTSAHVFSFYSLGLLPFPCHSGRVLYIILDHNPETCCMLHLVIYVAKIFSLMIIYIPVHGVPWWWGVGGQTT